jgi:hypothetical protein
MEKYRPDIVVDVGPELLDDVVEPLRSLLVGEVDPAWQLIHQHPDGVCTNEFLSRKPGFLLSAMHNHAFRWFSAAPPVFLFLGFLSLQLNQILRIFCVLYGDDGGRTLLVCLCITASGS